MKKMGILSVILVLQGVIVTASVYWYQSFFTPQYLRGGSMLSLYAIASIAIVMWALLLTTGLRIVASSDFPRPLNLVNSLLIELIYAVITLMCFEQIFAQYPVIFLVSWIIPVIILSLPTVREEKG